MKSGLTYPNMYEEIKRQSTTKLDYMVNPLNVKMDSTSGKPMLRVLDTNGFDQVKPLEIQDTIHMQMSQYLDIPWRYYKRLLKQDPDLLVHNVNRCIRKGETAPRLLRTLDGTARAFLSKRYKRIEHQDVFEIAMPVLEDIPGLQFESCELTPDHMYLKAVNPRLTGEVRVGDVVQFGIVISNSETGRGSLSISPLVYRLICSNGMTVTDVAAGYFRRYHSGCVISSNEDFWIYPAEDSITDNEEFVKDLQKTILSAMDEAKFSNVIDKMKASTQVKLNTEDLSNVVKQASASFKIKEAESEGVLRHLKQDGDFTLYGLANAVTRFSQDVESYERATELEGIGYSIMTMHPNLFKQINQVTHMAA